MKFGMRKPSIKRSIKARTTGRVKRAVKSSINPTYGKKGVGFIKDPKKSVYNKVYNKTTVGLNDFYKDNDFKTSKENNISLDYDFSDNSSDEFSRKLNDLSEKIDKKTKELEEKTNERPPSKKDLNLYRFLVLPLSFLVTVLGMSTGSILFSLFGLLLICASILGIKRNKNYKK